MELPFNMVEHFLNYCCSQGAMFRIDAILKLTAVMHRTLYVNNIQKNIHYSYK